MKVIAINGSPHSDGVTAKGISVMIAELAKEGIESEIIHVGHKNIQGCIHCLNCKKLNHCSITGDPVIETSEKIQAADGLIIGSPVYFGGIAGTFKSFLDRLFYPVPNMKYKVGATVVALRRSGGISVFHQLNNYLNLAQMVITPSMYWDVIHGTSAQEVMEDQEGLQIMEVQGRNMAWLIKTLAAGKKEAPLPPPVERKRTNFIH